jgi:hypothetical protein
MTHSDEARRAGNRSVSAAQERLRTELLTSGLHDWVPLIEVKTAITHYNLAETIPAQQSLALQTLRSLLEDGLMQIGDLPGTGENFPAWNLTVDAAMERVHDRFVRHYGDPEAWEFSIWLGLTESGKRLAENLVNSGSAG